MTNFLTTGLRTMNHNLLIRNARLVHASHTDAQCSDIYIRNGVIAGLNAAPADFAAPQIIDAQQQLVSFALADLATRLQEKGGNQRDMTRATLAAAVAGGVAHVAVLPDSAPILDEPNLIELLTNKSRAMGLARVHPIGALTNGLAGEQLAEMLTLRDNGCVAFSQADVPLKSTQVLNRALAYAASFDLPVWLRAQDASLGGGVVGAGAYASRLGLAGMSVAAEAIALHTLFELLRSMGASAPRVHICRISSARAVELIRAAKAERLRITCDVNMHHLHLVDTDMGYFDSQFVFNPPLRSSSDRAALRSAVLDGTIDAVVSDHVAVDVDAKQLPVGAAQAGSVGVQWLLSLLVLLAHETHTDIALALAPAVSRAYAILGLPVPEWRDGARADLVIFNPDVHQTLSASRVGAHLNTPYLGYELPAEVSATLINGQIVYAQA
ncbi:MAG: dihydroorotase [Formosimonas sp.]